MTHFCVDASTVLKWLLDEDDSRLARKLRDSGHDFIAPDLLPIELTSGIWKAHRSGKIGVDTAAAYVAATQTLPVTLSIRGNCWKLRSHSPSTATVRSTTASTSDWLSGSPANS